MSKLTVLYALFSAILYVVLVRRHTRVEEETGRAELAAGNAIGRNAPLAAVALECGAVAFALGFLVAVADMAGGLPVAGSMWFGVSWLGTGLVATGVAAVACQPRRAPAPAGRSRLVCWAGPSPCERSATRSTVWAGSHGSRPWAGTPSSVGGRMPGGGCRDCTAPSLLFCSPSRS